jgi:hypothetical protein
VRRLWTLTLRAALLIALVFNKNARKLVFNRLLTFK